MTQHQILVPTKMPRFPEQQTVDYYQQIGQTVAATSPIVAAARAMRQQNRYNVRHASGTGEVFGPLGSGLGTAVLVGLVVLTGALSYQAGKAMAPNKSSEASWGWIGVPMGVLAGPWGLGIMGVVSNSRK